MDSLGARIKHIRKEILKCSQEALATLVGMQSKVAVSKWENNEREPEVSVLVTITKESGTSLQWLLTGNGPMMLVDINIKSVTPSISLSKEDVEMLKFVLQKNNLEAMTRAIEVIVAKATYAETIYGVDAYRYNLVAEKEEEYKNKKE
ncbi:TPA: hypothetical protein DD449_02535 [Candidatus Berkelbacteria bacterium]|nr:hypothetical protein [Candidatus Berkelbacteria bacterium]